MSIKAPFSKRYEAKPSSLMTRKQLFAPLIFASTLCWGGRGLQFRSDITKSISRCCFAAAFYNPSFLSLGDLLPRDLVVVKHERVREALTQSESEEFFSFSRSQSKLCNIFLFFGKGRGQVGGLENYPAALGPLKWAEESNKKRGKKETLEDAKPKGRSSSA